MQQSNSYIILFAVGLTIVLGALLALASKGLEPAQKANIRIENMSFILETAGINTEGIDVEKTFLERVKPIVVDANGQVLDGVSPESIDLVKQYKKDVEERTLPIYQIVSAENPDQTDYFVFPIHGFGLWDRIWGYVALERDLNTIKGVIFDHAAETKGLGARIADDPKITNGFIGKKVFDGTEVELAMMKGEVGNEAYSGDPYKVDGMSGATLTAKGVNNMFENYFKFYLSYINKIDGGTQVSVAY